MKTALVLSSLVFFLAAPAAAQVVPDNDPPVSSPCWMIDEFGQVIDLSAMCDGLTGMSGSMQQITMTYPDGRVVTQSANPTLSLTVSASPEAFALSTTATPTVGSNEGLVTTPWLEALQFIESGGAATHHPIVQFTTDGASGGSGSSSGPCDYPGQTDSRGYRCGGRAASERRGGRL